MRVFQATVCLLIVLAQTTLALDITTGDGEIYRQCEVTRIEPDALRISHANGAARIAYEKLPSALQKQYFDPAKVAAYRKQVEETKKAEAAKAAEEQRKRELAAAQAREEQARKEAFERAEAEKQAIEERKREEQQRIAEIERSTAEAERRANEKRVQSNIFMAFVIGGLFVYFLPTIVGARKANSGAIFALNLFLGWTFLGWVIALVWACTKDSAMETLARQRLNMPKDDGRYLE
jgi:cation transport ATPase